MKWAGIWIGAIVGYCSAGIFAFQAVGQDSGSRGVQVVPAVQSFSQGSQGLFIGINEFEEPDLAPLSYAVNDAILQAYVFVEELKLIPADRCWIALSGSPAEGSKWEGYLKELRAAGVKETQTTQSRLLRKITELSSLATGEQDLLVISISSHGLQSSERSFFLARDSLLGAGLIESTGVSMELVESSMRRSKAGKKFLVVDACRNGLQKGQRNVIGPQKGNPSEAFKRLFSESTGQVAIMSCDAGQVSFEDAQLGQGVFTHFLVRGLRGEAQPEGIYITLGGVGDYVAREVSEWVMRNKKAVVAGAPAPRQDPWFKGPQHSRAIPLAVSITAKKQDMGNRISQALEYLEATTHFSLEGQNRIPSKVYEEVAGALIELSGDHQELLLRQIEGLKNHDRLKRLSFLVFWNGVKTEILKEASSSAGNKNSVTQEVGLAINDVQATKPGNNNQDVTQPEGSLNSEVAESSEILPVSALSDKFESRHRPKLGENFVNEDLGIEMVWINPGSFPTQDEAGSRRRVRVSQGFWIADVETTQEAYRKVMGNNPSIHKRKDKIPVNGTTWNEAVEFCRRLTTIDSAAGALPRGYSYQLPTEAMWEYACRAGTQSTFYWGESRDPEVVGRYCWFEGNIHSEEIPEEFRNGPQPVRQKLPNNWGLYDMSGNVYEWCRDWFTPSYPERSMDPVGPAFGDYKVVRGGDYWQAQAEDLLEEYICSSRRVEFPNGRIDYVGFRIVICQNY